jgi:DNA-binding MarR family transcriptional regulator
VATAKGGRTGAETATAEALNSGAIHLLRSLDRVDRESGLTAARLSALSVLVFGGPCSLGELARAERVAGPTMTRIVDGLVALGLAERGADPVDGRAVRIAPTDEGMRLMRQARDRRVETIAAGLQRLTAEQRSALAAAAPLLDELARAIRDARWGG